MPVLKLRRRQGENMSPPPPREGTFHSLLPSRAAPAPRFSQGFLRTSENPWPRSPRWGERAVPPPPTSPTSPGEQRITEKCPGKDF